MRLHGFTPLVCSVALLVVPAARGDAQDLLPIADRSRRSEIPGVSVLPPQGEHWFLLRVSPREDIPPDTALRFVQRLEGPAAVGPERGRQIIAAVLVRDSGHVRTRTPAELLAEFTGEFVRDGQVRVNEMLTSRQRLIGFAAALDHSLGAPCVSNTRTTEIAGQFPAQPDLVAILVTRGLYCMHPVWPQYDIDVTYQQAYPKGEAPLPRDAEAEAFLKSVVFTPARPAAPPAARTVLLSNLQAAEAAYTEKRWSEAQALLEAALRVAGGFGPNNPAVAAALYYLGSTHEKQNRLADGETFFRRALEIFDAAGGSDDVVLAGLHAQTLNDLAVIQTHRALRGQAPEKDDQFKEAERLHRRAFAIREKTVPADVGQTLDNLTRLYSDWARWDDAVAVAERAVSFFEGRTGGERGEVVSRLTMLADIHLRAGRIGPAGLAIERVVSEMQREPGADPAAIARVLDTFATRFREAGGEEEARKLESRANAIRANR